MRSIAPPKKCLGGSGIDMSTVKEDPPELESELHKLAEGPLRTMSSSDCKCLIKSSAVEGKE